MTIPLQRENPLNYRDLLAISRGLIGRSVMMVPRTNYQNCRYTVYIYSNHLYPLFHPNLAVLQSGAFDIEAMISRQPLNFLYQSSSSGSPL